MPSRKMINDIIDSGVIGEVTSLSANLGYELSQVKGSGIQNWQEAQF